MAETSDSTIRRGLRAVINCANTTGFAPTAPNTDRLYAVRRRPHGADGLRRRYGPKANKSSALLRGAHDGGNISVAASDPQGANGATGSGFGATPVLVSETKLAPSGATGQAQTCVIGTPTTPVDGTCSAPLARR